MSISNYLELAFLEVLRGNPLDIDNVYIKLHTGDPGESGASNAAGETTRKLVTFAAAASGAMASNSAAEWTNVSTTETYAYVSLWDASTAGNCLWAGALSTPRAVVAGDTFTIPSGSLTLSID